jgi:hypothetical protein
LVRDRGGEAAVDGKWWIECSERPVIRPPKSVLAAVYVNVESRDCPFVVDCDGSGVPLTPAGSSNCATGFRLRCGNRAVANLWSVHFERGEGWIPFVGIRGKVKLQRGYAKGERHHQRCAGR